MRKFFIILQKEIKELLTVQMIAPLLITVVIFMGIGEVISTETEKATQPQPIGVIDKDNTAVSQSLTNILEQSNFSVTAYANQTPEEILYSNESARPSLVLLIPAGFATSLQSGQPEKLETYNAIRSFALITTTSEGILQAALQSVNDFVSTSLLQERLEPGTDIANLKNPVATTNYVLANGHQASGSLSVIIGFLSSQTYFIPIILFVIIMLAAQMIATSMANEKENKTLETLLSLPVSRQAIVTAKLLASGLVAMLFAAAYIIGFRGYMQGMTPQDGLSDNSANINDTLTQTITDLDLRLGNTDYLLLGVSIFFAILAALAIAMILGAMVDDVKSVQGAITPLMIMILIPYLLTMFLDFNTLAPVLRAAVFAIPFSHPFLAPQNLLFNNYWPVLWGILYQLVVFIAFVFLASKLFSSDKILTLKFSLGKKRRD